METLNKFFICDRVRCFVSLDYVIEFVKRRTKDPFGWGTIKYFDTFKEAEKARRKGFYDDSDVIIAKVLGDEKYELINFTNKKYYPRKKKTK